MKFSINLKFVGGLLTYALFIIFGPVPWVVGLAAYAETSNWIMFVIGGILVPIGWFNGMLNLVAGVF